MGPGGSFLPAGRRRDLLAGILCVVAGIVVLLEARKYTIGSLHQIGAGLYPAILGSLLALVGLAIVGTAIIATPAVDDAEGIDGAPDWRGWSCIVMGVVLFILVAWLMGLAPAIFACVFVSALGDRTATLRGSLNLAISLCAAGTVLFGYLLGINMPLWQLPWTS
jgi:hypothetical protein